MGFLASMVSRNAGWNMTDLEGRYYATVLPQTVKNICFNLRRSKLDYFLDAFPQLLLYEESKRRQIPLFHLLQYFNVSILWKKNGYILGEKRYK